MTPSPFALRFFVGGVGVDATEAQLRTAFGHAGVSLKEIHFVLNHATGLRRGFAFVSVDSPLTGPAIAPGAILDKMRGVTVNDRLSDVQFLPAPLGPQWAGPLQEPPRADGR
jgi:hypothetical protein